MEVMRKGITYLIVARTHLPLIPSAKLPEAHSSHQYSSSLSLSGHLMLAESFPRSSLARSVLIFSLDIIPTGSQDRE